MKTGNPGYAQGYADAIEINKKKIDNYDSLLSALKDVLPFLNTALDEWQLETESDGNFQQSDFEVKSKGYAAIMKAYEAIKAAEQ